MQCFCQLCPGASLSPVLGQRQRHLQAVLFLSPLERVENTTECRFYRKAECFCRNGGGWMCCYPEGSLETLVKSVVQLCCGRSTLTLERFWNKLFWEPEDKRAGDDLFLKSSEKSGTFIYTHNLRHSSTVVLVRSSVGSMWLWWFCKASSHSFNSFHSI